MIIPSKHNGYTKDGIRRMYIGGGGGGPTNSTVTQSNVPDWLRPQVENVLMGAGKNLFQTTKVDTGQKNEDGTPIYRDDITGTKPFTPYSSDPSKYVAGFSPLQQQVQYNAANLQVPGQFNQATGYANQAAQGGLDTAKQAAGYGNAGFQSGQMGQAMGMQAAQQAAQRAAMGEQAAYGYGAQGQQSGLMGQQLGMQGGQMGIQGGAQYGQMGAQAGMQGQQSGLLGQQIGTQGGAYYGGMGANMGQQAAGLSNQALGYGQAGYGSGQIGQQLALDAAQRYGAMGAGYGEQGAQLGMTGGQYYGGQGSGYGASAAALAPQAQQYGQSAADIGRMGLRAESLGQDITGQARGYAAQQAAAGQDYARQMTNPYAVQQYMNPYQSAVTDVQVAAAQRQADIAAQGRKSAAARAGAFGGSRQAIENAEANRALATQQDMIRAQGQQAAYDKAIQAMQYGSNLGLQGLGGAQSGLGTALQGGQLGLSGIGQALAGQQAGLAGLGQAGSLYGQGMQGSSLGLQALQQQLAGTAQGMQGAGMGLQAAQTGLQGTAQGMQGAQAGLSGVNAANQAYQTGIQGAGMGLQGVNAQLAGTAQGIQGSQAAMQGAGVGLSGVDRQLAGVDRQLAGTAQGMQGAQVGLQGVDRALASGQLALQGTDRGLAGTAQGMQGAQVGLQGVSGQQAGYGLANQAAGTLGTLGNQQLAAQTGILGLQNQIGGQQQGQQQQIINQAIQNYANAQNAPMDSFNQYNALLRGYAVPGTTTTQYQAQASPLSQFAGLGTAGIGALGLYNATSGAAAGSDIRVKENIERVGTLANGLGLYDFEYKPEFKDHPLCGYGRFRGVMAQEVEKLIPEAVVTMDNGYKAVKYDLVEMELS